MSEEAFPSTSNVVKSLGGRGSAPDPAEGAYSAPPDPLAGGQGAPCPLPMNPIPALGPSGLEPRGLVSFGYSFQAPISSNPEYAAAKPIELSVFKLFIFTLVIVGNLSLNKRTHGPDLP